VLKALVIQDDAGRLKDLGDVLAVARAEGKRLFHTSEKVGVVDLFKSFYAGKAYFIVVVELKDGCSVGFGVNLRKQT
jgi:hypothetical protein